MINLCHVCAQKTTAPNQATGDERPTSLPVDDAFTVQEEEADCHLRCIKAVGYEEEKRETSLTVTCFIFQKSGQGFKLILKKMDDDRSSGGLKG